MMTRSGIIAAAGMLVLWSGVVVASPGDPGEQILEFDPADVTISERDGDTRVDYAGAVGGLGEVGAPDLPTRVLQFEIPADRTIADVRAEILDVREIATGVTVAPVILDHQPGTLPPVASRDARIYQSGAPFPYELAVYEGRAGLRGHTIATLHVRPWIYEPDRGRLALVTRLRLRFETAPAPRITLERYRIDPAIENRFRAGVAALIHGSLATEVGDLAAVGGRSGSGDVAGPGPFQPTFRPTPDGSPVEYVIVTSEALAPEFERLAEWKTKKGVQATVRTIEWIDATYPNGVDQAERVRFFVRDAYQNWGTLWLLLGGDTDVVPFRYAETTLLGGESIPADYYYMCLDGNWNADGDDRFAEGQFLASDPVDDADLMPEVLAGRAPVSTLEEATAFVDKTLGYETDPPAGNGYPASVLFLAERLFDALDGATVAEAAAALVPPWFKVVKLYEEFQSWPGSLALTKEAAVDSINNGFGFVHHTGHGYRNTMSVGDESLTNADADNFSNATRSTFVFGINCSSASIDFNSIGERWIKNVGGGAIAYYGTSRYAFVNASTDIQEEWFTIVFEDSQRTLGEACTFARLPFVATSKFDNAFRWTLMALTLLGDPETDLYTNAVVELDVAHATSHELGSGPLAVTVTSSGAPVEGASVTAWREGELFTRALTDGAGVAQLTLPSTSAGDVDVTVHKSHYRPYLGVTTLVSSSGPYPSVQSLGIDDDASGSSSGDGDGRVDAGETIELGITVENGGGTGISGATGILTVDDPGGYVTLVSDTVSYGTIGSGGASQGSGRFVLTFDPAAPEAFQPILTLTLNANEGSWSDVFVLPVRRAYLEHLGHGVDDALPRGNGNGEIEAGEQIYYTIDLRNSGQQTALDVGAMLRVVRAADGLPEPLVTVTDDQMSFGDIAVGATVTGDRFDFTLDPTVDPSTIRLEVTISDVFDQTRVELLDVIGPGVPDSLRAFGSPTSITIKWNVPEDEDIRGYDVFRSDAPSGPFTKINNFLAEGSAVYEDRGLPPLTRFYYQVVARDSSFNQGPPSEVFSGTTNPPYAPGWPIAMTQSVQSSVQIADLEGDWSYELFTASDYQYGWRFDGTEIIDGDDDPRTSGVMSELGFDPLKGFGATTALGDVDGDGTLEICNVAWTAREVYLWNQQGQIMPGWPKSVLDDFNWASPVLADLDIDGDLEIIVWAAKGGRLFAWHHDGTELLDGDANPATDGVLRRIFGISFNYSTPAVGELDGDPDLEIVFCSNLANTSNDPQGAVFVINRDGTDVPGWPVATGDATHISQITASPAIVDLDNSGLPEIVVASERDGGLLHVFNADGSDYPGWPIAVASFTGQTRVASPSIADVDNDGSLDIVLPGSNGQLLVFDQSGVPVPGFPVSYLTGVNESTQSTASVGDIDDDGFVEILFGDERGKLNGFNHDGTPVDGFPIQLSGEVRSTPAIWDIDSDSKVEVAVAGWDQNIYVWDLPFDWHPDRLPWPLFRRDPANTGNFARPLQIGIQEPATAATPARAIVHPPSPNPFNPRTRFTFEVPGQGAQPVDIAVYDVGGRLVRRLVQGWVEPGTHTVEWDGRTMEGRGATTGVYFYRAAIGTYSATGKLTLLK